MGKTLPISQVIFDAEFHNSAKTLPLKQCHILSSELMTVLFLSSFLLIFDKVDKCLFVISPKFIVFLKTFCNAIYVSPSCWESRVALSFCPTELFTTFQNLKTHRSTNLT